ncbi:uncharacterized protein [Lepisosteus oculatus]|uniref:uncharacterized protein n=1 Tax=Lepisosteus oculatus TaxID=7918 RepID=UPI0035F4FEE3
MQHNTDTWGIYAAPKRACVYSTDAGEGTSRHTFKKPRLGFALPTQNLVVTQADVHIIPDGAGDIIRAPERRDPGPSKNKLRRANKLTGASSSKRLKPTGKASVSTRGETNAVETSEPKVVTASETTVKTSAKARRVKPAERNNNAPKDLVLGDVLDSVRGITQILTTVRSSEVTKKRVLERLRAVLPGVQALFPKPIQVFSANILDIISKEDADLTSGFQNLLMLFHASSVEIPGDK